MKTDQFDDFLLGKGFGFTFNDLDQAARRRVKNLVVGDFVNKTETGAAPLSFDEAYDKLLAVAPKWDDPASFIFWRDLPAARKAGDNLKLMRIQRSGLCYMHAPAVLQHYLVTMSSAGKHYSCLNVSRHGSYLGTLSNKLITNGMRTAAPHPTTWCQGGVPPAVWGGCSTGLGPTAKGGKHGGCFGSFGLF